MFHYFKLAQLSRIRKEYKGVIKSKGIVVRESAGNVRDDSIWKSLEGFNYLCAMQMVVGRNRDFKRSSNIILSKHIKELDGILARQFIGNISLDPYCGLGNSGGGIVYPQRVDAIGAHAIFTIVPRVSVVTEKRK
jgi:hypothetical protein